MTNNNENSRVPANNRRSVEDILWDVRRELHPEAEGWVLDEVTLELQLLQKERDEARRLYCVCVSVSKRSNYKTTDVCTTADDIAAQNGWDCYKETQ